MTEEEITTCLRKAYDYFENTTARSQNRTVQLINKKEQCNIAMSNFLQGTVTADAATGIFASNGILLGNKQLVFAYGKFDVTFDYEQNQVRAPMTQIHDNMIDLII